MFNIFHRQNVGLEMSSWKVSVIAKIILFALIGRITTTITGRNV